MALVDALRTVQPVKCDWPNLNLAFLQSIERKERKYTTRIHYFVRQYASQKAAMPRAHSTFTLGMLEGSAEHTRCARCEKLASERGLLVVLSFHTLLLQSEDQAVWGYILKRPLH